MPPKKKVPLKEVNSNANVSGGKKDRNVADMFNIMEKIQSMETTHNKFLKEMHKLYSQMKNEVFMDTLFQIITNAMEKLEDDSYANTALEFVCKFLTSFPKDKDEDEDEISVPCKATFDWILTSDGTSPHLKFRLCQLVNTLLSSLGPEAKLDDLICEQILHYMTNRLKNTSHNVRAQAIYALQRLQEPNNPEDLVIRYFIYHLQSDPSSKVRQAIITTIARTAKTIPYIIERLWDVDEKVRRHTYLQMCGYPVKMYRLAIRLMFLEQGLNDESKSVKKIVTHLMIPQWVDSYDRDYIKFLTALKLNATEEELQRYETVARLTLNEIFSREKFESLIDTLAFEKERQQSDNSDNEDGDNGSDENDRIEFKKCVPISKMTIEYSLFWSTLAKYLYDNTLYDIDLILPELRTFCEYLTKFYRVKGTALIPDWQKLEYQHIFNNLIGMLNYFDLADEIGRENLKILTSKLLRSGEQLHENAIEILVKRSEVMMPDKEERFEFFKTIVQELYNTDDFEFIADRPIISRLIREDCSNIQIEISRLKVKILDFQEQITNYLETKDYDAVQSVTKSLNTAKFEYNNLLEPIINSLPDNDVKLHKLSLLNTEKQQLYNISKGLKALFFLVASVKVNSLTLSICPFYNNFIRRQIESTQFEIRNWALKCATAFGLLYEPLAQDVFIQLTKQFSKTKDVDIWVTTSEALFSLITQYGLKHFDINERHKNRSSSKNSRQLFRGNATDYLSQDDEDEDTCLPNVLSILAHIFETCSATSVSNAILKGYCMMSAHGTEVHPGIISKLLLKYFDPNANAEAQQMLGIFFNTLIALSKESYLEAALLPTVHEILNAGYDSTLSEIKPSVVIKFVLNATKPENSSSTKSHYNIHNTICTTFLKEIVDNYATNKELVKVLSSELINLHITHNYETRKTYDNMISEILADTNAELDPKSVKQLQTFKRVLDGTYSGKPSLANSGDTTEISDKKEINNKTEDELSDVDEPLAEGSELDPQNKNNEEKDEDEAVEADDTIGPPRPITPMITEAEIHNLNDNNRLTAFNQKFPTNVKNLRKSMNVNAVATTSSVHETAINRRSDVTQGRRTSGRRRKNSQSDSSTSEDEEITPTRKAATKRPRKHSGPVQQLEASSTSDSIEKLQEDASSEGEIDETLQEHDESEAESVTLQPQVTEVSSSSRRGNRGTDDGKTDKEIVLTPSKRKVTAPLKPSKRLQTRGIAVTPTRHQEISTPASQAKVGDEDETIQSEKDKMSQTNKNATQKLKRLPARGDAITRSGNRRKQTSESDSTTTEEGRKSTAKTPKRLQKTAIEVNKTPPVLRTRLRTSNQNDARKSGEELLQSGRRPKRPIRAVDSSSKKKENKQVEKSLTDSFFVPDTQAVSADSSMDTTANLTPIVIPETQEPSEKSLPRSRRRPTAGTPATVKTKSAAKRNDEDELRISFSDSLFVPDTQAVAADSTSDTSSGDLTPIEIPETQEWQKQADLSQSSRSSRRSTRGLLAKSSAKSAKSPAKSSTASSPSNTSISIAQQSQSSPEVILPSPNATKSVRKVGKRTVAKELFKPTEMVTSRTNISTTETIRSPKRNLDPNFVYSPLGKRKRTTSRSAREETPTKELSTNSSQSTPSSTVNSAKTKSTTRTSARRLGLDPSSGSSTTSSERMSKTAEKNRPVKPLSSIPSHLQEPIRATRSKSTSTLPITRLRGTPSSIQTSPKNTPNTRTAAAKHASRSVGRKK